MEFKLDLNGYEKFGSMERQRVGSASHTEGIIHVKAGVSKVYGVYWGYRRD